MVILPMETFDPMSICSHWEDITCSLWKDILSLPVEPTGQEVKGNLSNGGKECTVPLALDSSSPNKFQLQLYFKFVNKTENLQCSGLMNLGPLKQKVLFAVQLTSNMGQQKHTNHRKLKRFKFHDVWKERGTVF